MDQGLFAKHTRALHLRNESKLEIISLILEKTHIHLHEEEVSLSKKRVSITTSSVKRSALIQKDCEKILQSLGYILKI